MKTALLAICGLAAFEGARADTPAHCLWNQTAGVWTFYLGENVGTNAITCPSDPSKLNVDATVRVKLGYPNIATFDDGDSGTWSMIYDEAFYVQTKAQRFLAYFNFTVDPVSQNATSFCGNSQVNTYHYLPSQPGALPGGWGCFYAVKENGGDVNSYALPSHVLSSPPRDAVVRADPELANKINSRKVGWTATTEPAFLGMPLPDAIRHSGKTSFNTPERAAKIAASLPRATAPSRGKSSVSVPDSFSWADVNGVDYTTPVRNQGQCGSCYSFASTSSLSSRYAIANKIPGSQQPMISPQGIVSCSSYSQGCNGGFGIEVFFFGEDYSIPLESCFPYVSGGNGSVPQCSAACQEESQYRFTTGSSFVGGYYGAPDIVEQMQVEILRNGPISVEFMVYQDFFNYKSGIYTHTGLESDVNPFVQTNHEVFIYGWSSEGGVPFWRVRNSWGPGWGMGGDFLILRGANECGIESIPSSALPVV